MPQRAIAEGEDSSYIDPERCNNCGFFVESYFCPLYAIINK
jgi:hypothetical protein